MAFLRLSQYAPDVDPTTQGIIKDGENLYPTERGLKAFPTGVNADVPTATSTAIAAVTLEKIDGSTRSFIGTANSLLETGSNSLTDRSRSGAYTSVTTWRFAQFRDTSVAAPDNAAIQFSSSGAFDDISGAPTAKIIEAVNNQVMALNIVTGAHGVSAAGDRWWCSALGTFDDWNPAIATQSASGRLSSTPGDFTAGRKLGTDFVAYKRKSMYLGRYVGPPEIWAWIQISEEIGAVSHEAVVVADTEHYFMGVDDFYRFDGSRPRSIGGPIRRKFFRDELSKNHRNKSKGVFNQTDQTIMWAYPMLGGDGIVNRFIVYHIPSGRWGPPGDLTLRALWNFIRTTGITYETLGNFYSTYGDLPDIPFDDPFWAQRLEDIAYVDSTNKVRVLSGSGRTAGFTLNTLGLDGQFSFFSRARPRFSVMPSTGQMLHSYSNHLGDSETSATRTASMSSGKFDFEKEARWHSLRFETTGDMEVLGVDIDIEGAGLE